MLMVFLLSGTIFKIFIAMIDEQHEKCMIDQDKKLVAIKNGLKIIYQLKENKSNKAKAFKTAHKCTVQMALILMIFYNNYKFQFKKMQEKQKLNKMNSESQNNSSQEQQNSNSQQNSIDSFIQDDQDVEDDYVYRGRFDDDSGDDKKKSKKDKKKHKKKLKKNRIKEDQSELDQGDLDVLEQQQQLGGRLNRLKKKNQHKKVRYSDQDQQSQGYAYSGHDQQHDAASESEQGYAQRSQSQQSQLLQVFGDQGGQIFQPQDQKRFFQQQQDKQIIALDIPQRYYYQLRNYAKLHNKSMQDVLKIFQSQDRTAQVKWIYTKGRFPGDENLIKQKIKNILQCLHTERIQIMYVYYYRRRLFADVFNRQDLWKIYKLDQEWFVFKEQFNKLRDNLVSVIFSFQEMPRLEDMLQKTIDIEKLKYFRQFQAFKLPQSSTIKKKNQVKDIISQVRQRGVQDWLKKSQTFLSPDNLFYNIENKNASKKAKNPLSEPREQLERILKSINPQGDRLRFPLLIPQQRIRTICHYLQLQLFSHPQLRQKLRQKYLKYVVLSTNPTSKGNQDINLYSTYFPVKRIRDKHIKTLNRQIWVLACQAQKNDLISIQLKFQWEQSGLEQRNFQGDLVFMEIIKYYYDVSVVKEGEVWNLFRRQVITRMLQDYFFPAFFKEVRDQLNKQGQQTVINMACAQFKKKLLVTTNKNQRRFLAMVLQDKKLGIVYVDERGQSHSPLQITLSNDQELKRFANDQIIKKYIQDFHPQKICIGANSRRSQTLRKAIRDSHDHPFSDLCPYQIPSLVAKQRRLQGSSQQLSVLQAISMARYQLNPLAQILTLWSNNVQENGILSMNLHPYQAYVDQRKLMHALQMVAVQVVNLVGVDINDIRNKDNDSGKKILQFVCGLGPRKAYDLYQRIKNQTILERKQLEQFLSGPLVFKNCHPFFKIQNFYHKSLLDKSDKQKKKQKSVSAVSLLDTTRIPLEWYPLTQSLCIKAIKNSLVDIRQRKIYTNYSQQTIALTQIFKHPQKVNSVDWIWKREENLHFDKDLVREELTNRFRMPEENRYSFNTEELFFSLLRETKHTLKKHMIVTVKIISVKDRFLNVVIPQNGLFGSIKIFQQKPQYTKGSYIKAIISSLPFHIPYQSRRNQSQQQQQLLKVQMYLSFPHKQQQRGPDHDCFQTCFHQIVQEIHPLIDLGQGEKTRFDLRKEDRPQLEVREERQHNRMEFRKISHRNFRNLAVGPAVEMIKNSKIGDFVIRPSSDGPDYLNITWHFFSGIIAHIKVRSQQKNISSVSAPVYRIVSDKDNKIYQSLDQIIQLYITPMNSLIHDVISNRKFMSQPIQKIQQTVKHQMSKDPNLIHYFFGCSPQYPQYFLLVYMYRDRKVIKELIKVRNSGMYFHDQVFSNLRELISWFKIHFKDREYQAFVKKYSLKK